MSFGALVLCNLELVLVLALGTSSVFKSFIDLNEEPILVYVRDKLFNTDKKIKWYRHVLYYLFSLKLSTITKCTYVKVKT